TALRKDVQASMLNRRIELQVDVMIFSCSNSILMTYDSRRPLFIDGGLGMISSCHLSMGQIYLTLVEFLLYCSA
ncbi:hypothetical protein KEM48_012062, partial [Puccinia striiformis f. sp. tritici PST-130]